MIRLHAALAFFVGRALLMAQAPSNPDFSATTKLVQVSVIAQDKRGQPVTNLRREDFQVFDNGEAQQIRLFLTETEEPSAASPEPDTRHTFTNRMEAPAGPHSGYSLILIDNLFTGSDPTGEEGATTAVARTLRMLRSLPTGQKIAIYAQGQKLQVICEFTADRDLLEAQLRKWKPSAETPADPTDPFSAQYRPFSARPSNIGPLQPIASGSRALGEAARIADARAASAGDQQMSLVADHLAGIPGRKNLIWISGRFVIGGRAIQRLNGAGVSIYPVDVDGVCRVCPPRPKRLMDGIAALTGGVAYYGRNDLDVATRQALEDGRVGYLLGFYSSGDNRASSVHQLALRVSRPGVRLRYRTSYQTEAPPASRPSVADFVQALDRPVDSTGILITASAARTRDRLDVTARLDVSSLDLVAQQGRWNGKAELVALFTAADGSKAGDVIAETAAFRLLPATYTAAFEQGISLHKAMKIPAGAVELKLLVGNWTSGKMGTLTIPLAEVKTSEARQN